MEAKARTLTPRRKFVSDHRYSHEPPTPLSRYLAHNLADRRAPVRPRPVAYLLGGLACQSKGVLELKQLERDVHLSLPGLRLGLITIHAVRGVPQRRRLLDFHHVVALAPDDLDPLLRGPDRTR